MEVIVVAQYLLDTRSDTIPENVNKVLIYYLSINVESTDIVYILLNSTYLPEITNLVTSIICVIVITILFSNNVLNFF